MPTTPESPELAALLDAALLHVPFDGWSEATFRAAIRDTGIDPAVARALCRRGALDLAVAFHRRGDRAMRERLRVTDLTEMRMRDRIAFAVRARLEAAGDKEAVRRGTTFFALPNHAAEGARLIWETADTIWTALGDDSDDVNWYTKRATLSAVYSATVLYWLGDETPDSSATWAFLDRRIADVMQFEKVKAQVGENPVLKRVFAGPAWVLGKVRAPMRAPDIDLPGRWSGPPAQE
ncbi:COQ9 family protein [Rhodosalinus sp. 5P4]|uniref:COQ9 family protein n=1 Tax=Rhodosalinus sp. 5P4 TaxID=3239196 RepID=UPI00352375F3